MIRGEGNENFIFISLTSDWSVVLIFKSIPRLIKIIRPMLPFASIININAADPQAVYIKISNSIITEISKGVIPAGARLPSSRAMSDILGVHRKTVVAAYEELKAQDWIISKGRQGTFVNEKLPIVRPISIHKEPYKAQSQLGTPKSKPSSQYFLDNGYPDVRLTSLKSLGRHYSSLLANHQLLNKMNYYMEVQGDIQMRQELVKFLHQTRGLSVQPEQVLMTRGTIMAFYLILANYINSESNIVIGKPGFLLTFEKSVLMRKGNLNRIAVDEKGLVVDELEALCQTKKIDLVMVIPHHHYPTTSTLSADRRIKLVELAKQYDFLIVEDDWDYDFHYRNSPILPLASLNHGGRVIYVGSFSKSISPSIRLGYVVADAPTIGKLTDYRRVIDLKGDVAMERAVSHLFKLGDITRNLKKSVKTYKKRRDLMCQLLTENFEEQLDFKIPEGGFGIWVTIKAPLSIAQIRANAQEHGIHVESIFEEGMRVGFASLTEAEIYERVAWLRKLLE